jgi:hypothetical protein
MVLRVQGGGPYDEPVHGALLPWPWASWWVREWEKV